MPSFLRSNMRLFSHKIDKRKPITYLPRQKGLEQPNQSRTIAKILKTNLQTVKYPHADLCACNMAAGTCAS